ncbi:tape measure protein [Convivina praedatoris]|uniref:tape measure protein n=2 Tax=Convivina TaxID=1697027 RepID=UPI00200E095E|nr:tape measure protein [Convivina sp. LMG 32447]CAH1853332.1 hypothetical protein R077815_00801 [Convivina sp. LMG 32447]
MADGSITIDFLLNDQTGPQFDKFKQKAADTGAEGYKSAKKPFDEPIVAKLDAQAKKQGINNFKQLLNELPKEKQTELLAKAEKGQIIDFENELRKMPSKVVTKVELNDNASTSLRSLKSEAKSVSEHFQTLKEVLAGTFAANIISSGIGAITSGLHEAVKAGMEFNKEQDTMKTVWHSLTEEAPQDGKVLVDYINDMSQHSIYAAESINKMAQSFYHVHSNVDETKRWTDSFVALGSTMHMTNDQLSEAGEMFAKIVAGGKASQEDLNVMINRFPMFGEAIQKATGKSMAQLQEMSTKGQLSAKEFTEALDYLGNKYKGGTSEAMTSMMGMSMYLHSRLEKLSGDVMKSSFNMSKSATSALQKITSDKAMEGYAKTISSAMSVALNGISKLIVYITDHAKDITSSLGSIVKIGGELTGGAWSVFSGIIKGIGSAFGGMTGKGKESGDALHGVANALKAIADHQQAIKTIGSIIAAAFVVSKLAAFVKGVKEVNETLKITTGIKSFYNGVKTLGSNIKATGSLMKGFSKTIKESAAIQKVWTSVTKTMIAVQTALNVAWAANPVGIIVLAVAALIAILVLLYKNVKPFRDFVNGFMKSAGKIFSDFSKSVGNALKDVGKWFTGIGKSISSGLSSAGKAMNSWAKSVGKVFSSIGKTISNFVKSYVKIFTTFWKTVGKVFEYGLLLIVGIVFLLGKALFKAFEPVFKPIAKLVTSSFKAISKVITDWFKTTQKAWKAGWKVITDVFTSVWNGLVKFFTPIIKWLGKAIDNEIKGIQKGWDLIWNTITNLFKSIWNGLVKFFKPIIEWFGDVINETVKAIQKTWDNVWNAISSFFGGIWKWISKTGSDAINGVHDTISSVLDSIGKVWNNMWRSFSDFFGSIWKDIKGFASDGMNGVLDIINAGVDAIDSVWKFFTGHETSIHHLGHVKFASGGTVGGEDGQMAMINDGGGSNWKELLQFPNGELKMSNQRNHVLPLPKGTRVYNGEETKQIMGMAGIQKYANGGVVGGLIDWGKGALNNVSSWIGDKFEAVTSFLKDPLKNVVNMITKATDGMYSGLHNFGDMAHGVWDNLYNPIADWFKKGLEEVKKSMSRSAPGGAGVERWRSQVKDALAATGMPTADWAVEKILRQIQTESGGNEKITQPGADPDGDGSGPAIGLMQTKRSTFNAFALPGHGDIFNGYDNLLSAISYIKARYGEGMSFIGEGHGYANGGRTNGVGIVGEVPGEDEWVTNPNRDSADRTIIGSIRETAAKQPNSFSAKLSKVIDGVKTGMNGVGYQPVVASANNTHTTNGGNVDLSGDVNLTIELDSGQIAQATYPKIKMLQNQDIQLKAQARGSIYGNY